MTLKTTSYKGTRDLYPVDMLERNYIFNGWRTVCESYGYQEYMAPMLEPLELYAAKSGEEIVNEQTYSFTDRGGRQMVIRPEMTPSVTRMVAARRQELPMPARLYSIANFMRYERPQHGREREFWQLNFDVFGIDDIYADMEIINMSHDILSSFGATNDMFTIKVNDRRLTNYIMTEYLSLDDEQTTRMIKLLDRFDKMPRETFDEAAADVIGADKLANLNEVISAKTTDDLPESVRECDAAINLGELINMLVNQRGLTNVVYDARLMRGFDYYTGMVFEAFDESPLNRRAMFGGGRYDGLVAMFGVETLPVVGVAPGETMLREFLLAHNLMPDFNNQSNLDIMILPMSDCVFANQVATTVAKELRSNGQRIAVDYTDRKLDKKTKAAVKQGVKYAIYIGEQEIADGRLVVKKLSDGSQETIALDGISQYFSEQ